LGRSAPRLQSLTLTSIPFPGMSKLLLSATHLVYLRLINIPHSGYISPDAMVASLSALSSLRILYLEFRSPQSHPDWEIRSLPPPKRYILPALTCIYFRGVTEYLEDLVTFIDAPQLKTLEIIFFNQIDFNCPRLAQFINRTPQFGACDDLEAHVHFDIITASVEFQYRTPGPGLHNPRRISPATSCREPDWQLSFMEQVCNSSLLPLSTVEDLYIEHRYSRLVWKNDAIENTL
jgi:hypothetical protein